MKRSFFQAAVTSILLYGCTTWTLTKRLEKKLDGNYTRILRAILNKSQSPLKTSRFVSEPTNCISQPALHILQRNADGVSANAHKLRQRLQFEKIDSYLIQETKLAHKGEGFLIWDKEGLVYQRIAEDYQPPLEKPPIQVQLSRRWWALNHNFFATPIGGPDILSLATTESGNLFLPGADLNAHSILWDEHQKADQRDELVEG